MVIITFKAKKLLKVKTLAMSIGMMELFLLGWISVGVILALPVQEGDDKRYEDIVTINTRSKSYNLNEFREFDIKISNSHAGGERKRRSALGFENEWPMSSDGNVYVPYVLHSSLDYNVRLNLSAAIADFHEKTCIRFVPRSSESEYIEIIANGDGCWSYVGMQLLGQEVSLDPGCRLKGIVIHELMHALGFYHEQSRIDRDKYIRVDFSNIVPEWIRQFNKQEDSYVYGGDYDYYSVMHYGNYAAAIDETKETLTVISNPSIRLGQREGFSEHDLIEINLKYRCGRKYVKYE